MPEDNQITFEDKIPIFFVQVLYVAAENPMDGTIMMPGPYQIEAWSCESLETDPPVLIKRYAPPVMGKNGSGCSFTIPC